MSSSYHRAQNLLRAARDLIDSGPDAADSVDVVHLLEEALRTSGYTVGVPWLEGTSFEQTPDWPAVRLAGEQLVKVPGPGWRARDGALEWYDAVEARADRLDRQECLLWLGLAIASCEASDTEPCPPG